MLSCFESESTLNSTCLIILSYIVVYNHDTYAHVSSASVSTVGMSFVMLKIKQHLHLEIKIRNSVTIVMENTKISARQTL